MKMFCLTILGLIIFCFQNCSPLTSNESNITSAPLKSLSCSPNDARTPITSRLERVSRYEIKNIIQDIFKEHMSASKYENFLDQIKGPLDNYPENDVIKGAVVADDSVTQNHIDALFELGEQIASFISNDNNIMKSLVGDCYSNSNDSCETNFIKSFGLKALRRPLSNEDVSHYKNIMDSRDTPYYNVLVSFLNSPNFYYHFQVGSGTSTVGKNTVKLGPYERASKLSFYFLRSLPDNKLFEAAENGTIMSSNGVKTQVERLIKSPLARTRLTKDFIKNWLHLGHSPTPKTHIEELKVRIGEIDSNFDENQFLESIEKEVYDFMDYNIWEKNASFSDIMKSNFVFPKSKSLAKIYGTDVWNGSYDSKSLVRAPAGQRAGPLTQAHFLYTGSADTRPIIRGVKVFEEFLCGNLSLPPDNDTPEGVKILKDMTDREYVRAITEVEGSSCVGCHKEKINPLGFSFDNFDSLGRFRIKERVFEPEGAPKSGEVLTIKDVQPETRLNIYNFIEGDFNNIVDISHHLATNPKANACFATKLWNYAQKQEVSYGKDPCAVLSVYKKLNSFDGSIVDAFKDVALQPEFLTRRIK